MKNVILTGVSGQLGQAFLRTLTEEGYFVFGVDILEPKDPPNSDLFKFVKMDISNEKEVTEFFGALSSVYGLVNNAGVGVFTPFEERTVSDFMRVVNVNLLGTFLMCREAIKKMKSARKGKIVNIGSIYGVVSSDPRIYGRSGRMNSEVYSMTKAGVLMFSQYLAAHYASYNIQVNSLSPGGVYRAQTEDFVSNYVAKTPAGRMGNPEDLQFALKFLLSDKNNYMNGQNIIVDGGFTSW